MNTIKTILFDFGGVILTLDPQEAVRRFKALGLEDAEQRLDVYTQSGIFGDMEKGKIDDEEFRVQLSKLVGHELSWDDCLYAWRGYCKEVPRRNLEALLKLRAEGYRVVLLSNTNPYMMSWALSDAFDGEGHPLSYYMDAIYMSYKCGAMKPDEQFFRTVISSERLVPEETLFLDDGPRNVAAASELGIRTFCTPNGSDWTKKIYEYLK